MRRARASGRPLTMRVLARERGTADQACVRERDTADEACVRANGRPLTRADASMYKWRASLFLRRTTSSRLRHVCAGTNVQILRARDNL